jgi:hypothetical protein
MAWPMPLAAPVTTAALPSSRLQLDCFRAFVSGRLLRSVK